MKVSVKQYDFNKLLTIRTKLRVLEEIIFPAINELYKEDNIRFSIDYTSGFNIDDLEYRSIFEFIKVNNSFLTPKYILFLYDHIEEIRKKVNEITFNKALSNLRSLRDLTGYHLNIYLFNSKSKKIQLVFPLEDSHNYEHNHIITIKSKVTDLLRLFCFKYFQLYSYEPYVNILMESIFLIEISTNKHIRRFLSKQIKDNVWFNKLKDENIDIDNLLTEFSFYNDMIIQKI